MCQLFAVSSVARIKYSLNRSHFQTKQLYVGWIHVTIWTFGEIFIEKSFVVARTT